MKHYVEDIEQTSEDIIISIFHDTKRLVEICNLVRNRVIVHPSQSNFRVAAVFIIEHKIIEEKEADGAAKRRLSFVCGSNAEQGYIGGAICAERATLCRLRFYEEAKIVKVIVTTDSEQPIAPGGLCREFLMSATSPETPVIAGNATGDRIVECELGALWPYPYLYRYCLRCNLMNYAEGFASSNQDPPSNTAVTNRSSVSSSKEAEKGTIIEDLQNPRYEYLNEVIQAAQSVNSNDALDGIHPLRFSGAVIFSDGHTESTWQWKALEYGCTIDPICQLLHTMRQYPKKQKEISGNDVYPKCIVMIDQFQICHAPFAAARSLLLEHGFEDVEVLVHNAERKLVQTTVKTLFPISDSFGANLSHDDFH